MARPRKPVSEDTVRELAAKGRYMREIAAYFGVSEDTISRNYADCVKQGRTLMRGSLRNKQYEIAMRGNPQMLIWLGKQELDQTDKQELTGDFKHEHTDLSHLSDEQLGQVESLIETADTRTNKG